MKLLTDELRQQLPPLYASEQDPDPLILCKFFLPDFHWRWYAIAFDGKDTFFGFVDGDEPELGYFTLSELTTVRGALGLPLERDLHFQPCRLSALKQALARRRR